MTELLTILFVVLPIVAMVLFVVMMAVAAITGAFALTAHVIEKS